MYYSESIESFLGRCTAIIGKREAGKTTILKKLLALSIEKNFTILAFDSATDHREKSFLIHAHKSHPSAQIIYSPEKSEICFDPLALNSNLYPANIISPRENNIYLFDVSRYLEEGYDTDNLVERMKIRQYYKKLVLQELFVMEKIINIQKCVILMDEIELLNEMKPFLEKYKSIGTTIVVALHSVDSLAECNELFDVITL